MRQGHLGNRSLADWSLRRDAANRNAFHGNVLVGISRREGRGHVTVWCGLGCFMGLGRRTPCQRMDGVDEGGAEDQCCPAALQFTSGLESEAYREALSVRVLSEMSDLHDGLISSSPSSLWIPADLYPQYTTMSQELVHGFHSCLAARNHYLCRPTHELYNQVEFRTY